MVPSLVARFCHELPPRCISVWGGVGESDCWRGWFRALHQFTAPVGRRWDWSQVRLRVGICWRL